MLVNFIVKNSRSIKESATLSAVAARTSARAGTSEARRRYVVPDNEIASTFATPGRRFDVLPALAIFGANASGKTNVLLALDEVLYRMLRGAWNGHNGGNRRDYGSPFLLDETSRFQPTEFFVSILREEYLYEYELQTVLGNITFESLKVKNLNASRAIPVKVFERCTHADRDNTQVTWGPSFKDLGERITTPSSRQATLVSPLLQHASDPALRPLANWCNQRNGGLTYVNAVEDTKRALISSLDERYGIRKQLMDLLYAFDIGIEDIQFEPYNPELGRLSDGSVKVIHKTDIGSLPIDLIDESHGTQRLICVLAKVVIALRVGGLVIVDELDASLHPDIVYELVRMFQDARCNTNHAQLIFSTHEASLLKFSRLRRDQVWFTEMHNDGGTTLFPLADFKFRNDKSLDVEYLDGRLGAVPRVMDAGLFDIAGAVA